MLELPDTAFELVLRFLSFEAVAKLRRVSRRFNCTGKHLLNKGFKNAEKYHMKCLKVAPRVSKAGLTVDFQDVKALLPRRESERRNHKLSRHCDILTAIETRLSLLNMTFMKYVDLDLCCFIPGKVIDEIYSVLRSLQTEEQPPRAYEILQELRDISSMSMEFFEETIVPGLPCPASPLKSFLPAMPSLMASGSGYSLSLRYPDLDSSCQATLDTPCRPFPSHRLALTEPTRRPAAAKDLDRVSKSNKKTNRVVRNLKKQADTAKSAVDTQNKKIAELDKRIDTQNEIIEQQNARLAEQEEKLAAMSRRLGALVEAQAPQDTARWRHLFPFSFIPCLCRAALRGESRKRSLGEEEARRLLVEEAGSSKRPRLGEGGEEEGS